MIRLLDRDEDAGPANGIGHRLKRLAASIDQVHTFEKGQLVKWKAGLRNRTEPAYDAPAIVREILESPTFDRCKHHDCPGSPYYTEALTIIIGVFFEDDFCEFVVDGRRFEPF